MKPSILEFAKKFDMDPEDLEFRVQNLCEHITAVEDGRHCDCCGLDLLADMGRAS